MAVVEQPLPAQLDQWTFRKSLVRSTRSISSASGNSSTLYATEKVNVLPPSPSTSKFALSSRQDGLLQERYLSSEEDLSPMEADDELSYDEREDDYFGYEPSSPKASSPKSLKGKERLTPDMALQATKVHVGKECGLAVRVSFILAGRPKIIDLSPTVPVFRERNPARLTVPALSQLRIPKRLSSLSVGDDDTREPLIRPAEPTPTESEPAMSPEPALTFSPLETPTATDDCLPTPTSPPAEQQLPTDTALVRKEPATGYYSMVEAALAAPPVPKTKTSKAPPPAFLNVDPFAKSRSPTPPINSATAPAQGKGRLRSLSRSLSIARALTSQITSSGMNTPTSAKSFAESPTTSTLRKQSVSGSLKSPVDAKRPTRPASKQASRLSSADSSKGMMMSTNAPALKPTKVKLVARGADERASAPIIPDFFTEDEKSDAGLSGIKRVRKRGSLMDLLAQT